MLLNIFEFSFTISGLSIIFLILIYKILFIKNIKNEILSYIIAGASFTLFIYILAGIGVFALNSSLITKFIILISVLSPFIIGSIVTYEKERYFLFLQLLIIAFSVGYFTL